MFKLEEILLELLELSSIKLSTLKLLGASLLTVALIMFVLKALAIFKMSKSLNLKNGWISFVPFLSIVEFGRVAQKYVRKNGAASAKFSVVLPIIYLLQTVLIGVFFSVLGKSLYKIVNSVAQVMVEETELTKDVFSSFVYVIILFFAIFGVAIAYKISYYVALWRIYAIFNEKNAALFTVLGIFLGLLNPIFLFVIRNRKPKLTFAERLGIELEFLEQ